MPLVFAQNEVTVSGHSYADVAGESYEFPARYLNLIRPGEQFVYYRGRRTKSGGRSLQVYFGCGIVDEIIPSGDRYRCSVTNYQPFDPPVPFKDGDRYLEPKANATEHVGFYFQVGVRPIDQVAFDAICEVGLGIPNTEPKYATASDAQKVDDLAMTLALGEAARRWPGADVRRMPHNNPGFDIEVRQSGGDIHYIEVKGTRASEPRFFISAGEVAYSRAHVGSYSIWIYHSMDLEQQTAKFAEHDGAVVGDHFELRPVQFFGRLKQPQS
ncbi:UNVERIFIED_ORG: uncharacterized protein DUF3883 [Gordonia westfalica J30]